MTERGYFNAYVAGDNVVLLSCDDTGKIVQTRVPAEYITYVKDGALNEDLDRALRSSAAVKGIKKEGSWLRIAWADEWKRRAMVFGTRMRSDDGSTVTMSSPLMSAGVDVYEGDVDPIRRYFTDSGATIQKPRRCFLDIEADSRVSFDEKTKARILSFAITVIRSDGFVTTVGKGVLEDDTDEAEAKLLETMWSHLQAFDQILAWNGDNYDFEMITARSDRMRVRVDPRRWVWLDQLSLFDKMNTASESGDEKQSLALQSVSMQLLGEGKEETPPEIVALFGNRHLGAMTWDLWAAGGKYREMLLAYNVKDAMLQARIEAKTGYAELFDAVCVVCRCFPNSRSLNNTQQVDGAMLRLGLESDTHFPTREFRESGEKFPGAYVMQPKAKGVTSDVHVGDFKSLYPSLIISWNMSPETKVRNAPVNGPIAEGHCRAPSTGITFRTDVVGILCRAVAQMLELRTYHKKRKSSLTPGTPEWKEADRLSTAYKVIANAFYGVITSAFSRYYDREIGESITQNGAWLIKQTIAAAEERGMRAIYCDTDSIFIAGAPRTEFEEFVKWCNESLYPELLAKCGCPKNLIELAYEKQFARIVFTAAKKYAGSYVHYEGKEGRPVPKPGETYDKDKHSKPEIKGLEYKRGDTALLGRRLQEHMILRVLSGDETQQNYVDVINDACKHVLEGELPIEEVRITQALTKTLREYVTRIKGDGTPGSDLAHVAIAKVLLERGEEVRVGSRIEYFVTDGSESPNKVSPAADYDGSNADRFYLWEDKVWPPVKRFLEHAFPDWSWDRWDKVRPKKPSKGRDRVLPGQLGLVLDPEEPYVIAVQEGLVDVHAWLPEMLRIVRKHPGKKPLRIVVCLEDGSIASTESKTIFVSGDSVMADELMTAWLCHKAASVAWAEMLH